MSSESAQTNSNSSLLTLNSSLTRVLLVEDNPGDARLIREYLAESGSIQFEVIHVLRLQDALESLDEICFHLILLDLSLPDSHGLDTVRKIHTQAPEAPILVLTGLDDESIGIEAVKDGAEDYLIKGHLDSNLLARSIRYAIERHQLKLKLLNLSMIDELTGLYNRRGFNNLAERHMKLAARTKRPFLIAFFDMDGLKQINDTIGHDEGSRAIIETAEVLKKTFRETDIISRWGGDEFVVLLIDSSIDSAGFITNRLQKNIEVHNLKGNRPYKLSISTGIAHHDPQNPCSLEELMAQADSLMYQQKRQKKMKGA